MFRMRISHVEAEDNLMGLGFYSGSYEYTSVISAPSIRVPSPSSVFTLAIGMDLSSQFHQRSVFTFWDYLGDVGGLYDMLILLGGSVVSVM